MKSKINTRCEKPLALGYHTQRAQLKEIELADMRTGVEELTGLDIN